MIITNFNYQRNGVQGDPFWSFVTNTVPHVEGESKYLVTFETQEHNDGELILIPSCRVVDLNNVLECWRGDQIAYEIASQFKASGFRTVWGWKESITPKHTVKD